MPGKEDFVDIAISKAGGIPAPAGSNVLRLSTDGSVLLGGLPGGAPAAFGGTFTTDTILQLLNSTPALFNALRFLATAVVTTPGAEEAAWDITAAKAGALSALVSIGFDLNTFPMLFVGARAGRHGIRLQGSAVEILLNGTAYLQLTGTELNTGSATFRLTNRLSEKRGAAIAVATTITLGTDGNVIPLTAGTGTLNSIVATGVQAGFNCWLECASGITITNNVAGTGATILTSTGANIVTAFTRMIPIIYNGTNWNTGG
jgi:hypothetical protein